MWSFFQASDEKPKEPENFAPSYQELEEPPLPPGIYQRGQSSYIDIKGLHSIDSQNAIQGEKESNAAQSRSDKPDTQEKQQDKDSTKNSNDIFAESPNQTQTQSQAQTDQPQEANPIEQIQKEIPRQFKKRMSVIKRWFDKGIQAEQDQDKDFFKISYFKMISSICLSISDNVTDLLYFLTNGFANNVLYF